MFQIISTQQAVRRVQFRFPHSKKRRIREKWEKRESNVRYEPMAYMHNCTIYAHPEIVATLNRLQLGPHCAFGL